MFNLTLLATAVLLAGLLSAEGNNLRDGLVAYWPLDTHDGSVTPDVAFTNAMSVIGNPDVEPGQRGNAFTFVGPLTYLTNGHSADNTETGLPIYRAGSYTIAMWVKGTNQTAKYLYAEGGQASNNPLLILQTGQADFINDKLDVIIRNDSGATLVNHLYSSNVVFDGTWHHIAWVDDHGNAKLYVDGNLDATDFTYAPSGVFTMETSAIGTLVRGFAGVATHAIFNGQIDDLALWERALSQDEINFVRTNGIPTPILPLAPGLYVEPADALKHTGDWHRFSAFAAGSRPLVTVYQWYKNGAPIGGATEPTLFLSSAEVAALNPDDFFSVTVSNSAGWITSSNATLTLVPDPEPDLSNGLVDYWPLDVIEEVGTNLNSPELHFGHDLVLQGFWDTNALVSGSFSNTLRFDGFSQFGFRTNGLPIYANSNYSISFWVRSEGFFQSRRRVFAEASSMSGSPQFSLGTDADAASRRLRVVIRDDDLRSLVDGRLSTRAVFDDTWHHVVWTDAAGRGKLYVDGVLDETDFSYTRRPTTVDQTAIGALMQAAAVLDTHLFGDVDEVATWNRVLTWTEIQQTMTMGIPVPKGVTAPSITLEPPQRTNDVYVGDEVTFPARVNGTFPIDVQWWRNGMPISGGLNSSALTDTLVLTNVQLADSNSTWFLIATNSAGSVTSSVARLYVLPLTPVTNGEALKIDVGLAEAPDLQPGFSEFTLDNNPATFLNAVRVTFSGIGGASLSERTRTSGDRVANNPPFMTQAQIYNDFVFARSTAFSAGMKIFIDRLAPNTPYGLTIWSFDPQSTGFRVSTWTETSSGVPLTIADPYTFDGFVQPTNDYVQSFGGLVTSSAEGTLQIEGVNSGGGAFGVFVNAIRLVANPSRTRTTRVELHDENLRLTVEADYPGQSVGVQQSGAVPGGTWSDAAGASIVEAYGPVTVFEIPLGADQAYFRAVSFRSGNP